MKRKSDASTGCAAVLAAIDLAAVPTRTGQRQLIDIVFRCAGHPHTQLRRVHPLLLRAGALTNPTLRELLEMQYQFDEPFIVDSTKISTLLQVAATPLEQALQTTLSGYRSAALTTSGHPR